MKEWLNRIIIDHEVAAAFDALPIDVNEVGYDPWGFHPRSAQIGFTLGKAISNYFRPEIVGIENIPEGRCLIVPNHAGQLPFDGIVVSTAALLRASPPRLLRGMAERWFPTIPFINLLFSRSGVVVGDPLNCRNLLEADNAILVFPEGARGSGKPFSKRYQMQDFGRGFMRLALHTGAPIVPVGIVGSEESIISLADLKPIAKLLGMPYLPLPALLPLLGPFAMTPMPTKFYIRFGEPMVFEGDFDDEDHVIEEKTLQVRTAVQRLVATGLASRTGWF